MLAIIDAYRTGLLGYKNWLPNISAGLIVGVVALPLAMAFAIASGATPAQGIYTAIVAALAVGLFGGSRIQIAGPTGAFIVILAHITARYGIDGLQIATLIAGFILLLLGFLHLGSVIKFIPSPVVVGFTSGIGIIIFVGEWKDFFGLSLKMALDTSFFNKIILLGENLSHLNPTTTGLGLLSLFILVLTPKIFKKIPGPLLAMLIITLLQDIFHFKGVATIGTMFGGIPQHLPSFHLPQLSFKTCLALIGPAFTIALLGSIESLLSATAADHMAHTRHHSNQELIGQGLANILAPLFGGFAATGAIARTATNVRNGGNSPIAAITHSIFLILVLLFLSPYADNIPLCCLAAILFVVAYNMSDMARFIDILRNAPNYDKIVLLTTFFLTIFTNLVVAVNIGVILALLFFLRRMIQSVKIEDISTTFHHEDYPADSHVYQIQGPIFFGVAEKLEQMLTTQNISSPHMIFCLQEVPFIDMTGLTTFHDILKNFHQRGIHLYLYGANKRVLKKLKKVGALQWVVSSIASQKRIVNPATENVDRT